MKLLTISSYPEKDLVHGNKTVGVASYSKNTLLNIRKQNSEINIEVFAELFDQPEEYTDESDIKVKRFWKRNSISSLFKIINETRKNDAKKVLAQFEMFMMGSSFFGLFYLLALHAIRLSGKEVILVVHQVINDPSIFEKNFFKKYFYKFSMRLFYWILVHAGNKVIVFEEELRNRLNDNKRITVVPHAVEQFEKLDKDESKKALNLNLIKKYVLYFGYLAEYKGVDDLINIYERNPEYEILIAGGENPNHLNNQVYKKYIDDIYSSAEKKKVKITGFIKEEDIPKYFSACDLLVLPYKTFMSSSGPLSMAFSFTLPILLSEPLKPYMLTNDFQDTLTKLNVEIEDMLYTKNEFNSKVTNILNSSEKYINFSDEMKKQRSWESISDQYIKIINK